MGVGSGQSPDPHIGVRLAQLEKETDPSFVREIVSQFLEEAPATLRQLNEALRSGDKKAAGAHAHKLKGGSLNMGAHKLASLLEQLEDTVRDAQASSIDALMRDIDFEFGRDCEYFRNFLVAR
jgi:HPt (histidine-containing phosphotransfer) domain-containing protein